MFKGTEKIRKIKGLVRIPSMLNWPPVNTAWRGPPAWELGGGLTTPQSKTSNLLRNITESLVPR
jgi:hypothetical protein